ncbi:MAG: WD40/YVTN/BNR-like repeat-containing protein, partial [Longimicrobiales bacterium]
MASTGVVGDPLTYYMGTVGGGVWKTSDAGTTWRNVTDGQLGTSSVGAVTVAESDPNVVYVGMGEHAVRGVMTSHGDGVYRSTDAGRTWTHVGLERTRSISRIRIHPDDPDLVYVAAQGAPYGPNEERGIYRSEDGGESWDLVLAIDENTGASDLAMDMTNPRILYASFWDHRRLPWQVVSGGPGSGFWKSTDGGDTWFEINDGLPDLMGKTAIDVSRADPDRLFAMVEADPGGGLFRSDDAGRSWQLVSDDWTIRARAWYYIEVFADPMDEETVYVLNAPMMKSIDGGRTFSSVRVLHGDTHDLWINPSDNEVMINANDGGAHVSFNAGETWSTLNNQPTAQFYRVNLD